MGNMAEALDLQVKYDGKHNFSQQTQQKHDAFHSSVALKGFSGMRKKVLFAAAAAHTHISFRENEQINLRPQRCCPTIALPDTKTTNTQRKMK